MKVGIKDVLKDKSCVKILERMGAAVRVAELQGAIRQLEGRKELTDDQQERLQQIRQQLAKLPDKYKKHSRRSWCWHKELMEYSGEKRLGTANNKIKKLINAGFIMKRVVKGKHPRYYFRGGTDILGASIKEMDLELVKAVTGGSYLLAGYYRHDSPHTSFYWHNEFDKKLKRLLTKSHENPDKIRHLELAIHRILRSEKRQEIWEYMCDLKLADREVAEAIYLYSLYGELNEFMRHSILSEGYKFTIVSRSNNTFTIPEIDWILNVGLFKWDSELGSPLMEGLARELINRGMAPDEFEAVQKELIRAEKEILDELEDNVA